MTRSRVARWALWCGATLAPLGCAQIAGLSGDYHPAAGASGTGGAASGTGGAAGGTGGATGGTTGGTDLGGGQGGNGDGTGGVTSVGGTGGSSGGGTAGASGSTGVGPTRVGYSEFHDSASGNDDASSQLADATFAVPDGTAAGDLLLVFFGSDHSLANLGGTDLRNRGWTLIDQKADYGYDGQATYLLYRFASAGETAPIVFPDINPTPSGNGVQGLLSVYRGVNPASPINAYEVYLDLEGGQDLTTAVTPTPAITTTVANCLLIAGLSPDSAIDAPVIAFWPDGFGDNQVSVVNPESPYPYGWANIYSAERHLPSAGTVPASRFTWTFVNTTAYYGSLSFVLALAP